MDWIQLVHDRISSGLLWTR